MKKTITEKDIKSVSEWLNTNVEDLIIEYTIESMSAYEIQAKEMKKTFVEFPKDEKRMLKILDLLKKGYEILPIYVEKNDPHNFIMEGRHRIVAFLELGLTEILVARSSTKKKSNHPY
jgi:uncharacterized protein YfbU (UPF0304 family)